MARKYCTGRTGGKESAKKGARRQKPGGRTNPLQQRSKRNLTRSERVGRKVASKEAAGARVTQTRQKGKGKWQGVHG
ncbi:MAG TPA: hypothetical protein VEY51_20915 [Chondromyces sp.]|nr:hypothetical protein [Chondromyces sp.]